MSPGLLPLSGVVRTANECNQTGSWRFLRSSTADSLEIGHRHAWRIVKAIALLHWPAQGGGETPADVPAKMMNLPSCTRIGRDDRVFGAGLFSRLDWCRILTSAAPTGLVAKAIFPLQRQGWISDAQCGIVLAARRIAKGHGVSIRLCLQYLAGIPPLAQMSRHGLTISSFAKSPGNRQLPPRQTSG